MLLVFLGLSFKCISEMLKEIVLLFSLRCSILGNFNLEFTNILANLEIILMIFIMCLEKWLQKFTCASVRHSIGDLFLQSEVRGYYPSPCPNTLFKKIFWSPVVLFVMVSVILSCNYYDSELLKGKDPSTMLVIKQLIKKDSSA